MGNKQEIETVKNQIHELEKSLQELSQDFSNYRDTTDARITTIINKFSLVNYVIAQQQLTGKKGCLFVQFYSANSVEHLSYLTLDKTGQVVAKVLYTVPKGVHILRYSITALHTVSITEMAEDSSPRKIELTFPDIDLV